MTGNKVDKIIKTKYIMCLDPASTIVEDGYLAVQSDRIVAIGKQRELDLESSETVELGNSLVMPGFINTHTHAAMVYFRGLADNLDLDTWLNKHIWPAEAELINPDFIKKASELAALEMIESGITMFNDMYFFTELSGRVAEMAGLRALVGDVILDFPSVSAKNPDEALRRSDKMREEFASSSLVDIALNPHSVYTCSQETLSKVSQNAKDYNLSLHIHLSETERESREAREKFGMSSLKHLDKLDLIGEKTILAHSIWVDDEDIEIIKKRKASISHNPVSNMKLVSGTMPIERLDGITVALASDGAASNNSLDLFSEMRTCSLVHKITKNDPCLLSPERVVRMATSEAAIALGRDKDIGSLELGKKADMISINLEKAHLSPVYNLYSHLVYCANSGDLENVMVDGRWILKNGENKTMDKERILREARDYSQKIKKYAL